MKVDNVSLFAVAVLVSGPVHADADPPPEGAFTIVVLPDTQYYAEQRRLHGIFLRQTQWVADHKESHDIRYVVHVGDVVQSNTRFEWDVAREAFRTLEEAGVPYAIAPGNHDYGPGGSAVNRETLFSEYFGADAAYGTQPTLGGFFEAGRTESSYHTFRAGERDWIILALEWGPRDSVVEWADRVLSEHPEHRGIVVTHAYMYSDDTRYDFRTKGTGQSWNPHSYGTGRDPDGTNDGEELWEKLVSRHDIAFVFSGHVLNDGTGRLMSIGESGQTVHQLLANYQTGVTGSVNGGNGFLRLMHIVPGDDVVHVRTYSPHIDEHRTEPDQEFSLALCDLPSDPARNTSACDVVAAFTVSPEAGEVPLEVRLDAGASTTREGRSIVSFDWDLGDGSGKNGEAVTHEYQRGGRHLIRLTVTDDRGLSATAERSVSVACPAEDVSPWRDVDVGEVLLPGGARPESGDEESCLSLCAAGRFLTGRSDDFHFVYQRVAGDVDISLRIARAGGSAAGAQVGVMLREGLDPEARFFATTLRRTRTSTRFRFQSRDATGESVRSKVMASAAEVPRVWVRVVRRGDVGIGYLSGDGVLWEEVQRRVIPDLSENVYAGIVAIGNESRDLPGFEPLDASVCEVRLAAVEPAFLRGDANASGSVNVADAVATVGFLSGDDLPCDDAADSNDDGTVGVSDAIFTLLYIFERTGEIPAPGSGSCGADATPDELACEAYGACE